MDVYQPAVRKRRSESVLGDDEKDRQQEIQIERTVYAEISQARITREARAKQVYVHRPARQRAQYYCCSCAKKTACDKRGACHGCGHDHCSECLVDQI